MFFYRFVGNRTLVILFLSALTALLDGIGLAMFIPLFQAAATDEVNSAESEFGELRIILEFFEKIGLELNMQTILVIVIVLFSAKGIFKFLESYYKVKVRLFFMTKVRYQLLDGMAGLSYLGFIKLDAGRIQNTLSVEVSRLYGSFSNYFNTIQSFILLLIYMALALLANFQFAILVIICGYLSNLLFKIVYKKTKLLSSTISDLGHQFQSYLIQSVQYFKYLKATDSIFSYKEKIREKIADIELSQKRIGFYDSILQATREPLVIAMIMVVILIQVSFFDDNLGSVMLSLMFFYRSINSVLTLQTSYQLFLSNAGSITSTEYLLKEFSTNEENIPVQRKVFSDIDITLTKISFSFNEKVEVLSEVSLHIPNKSSVAFVGESGSGKTTLINILSGLVNPSYGTVEVNGVDLTKADKSFYRRNIGYITQEPVIFNDTIFNNVTFWDSKTEENVERFHQALKLASVFDFVGTLPNMEETFLGDNGVFLSGGQRQRISISRELYKNVEILILDEATSALDSETERQIQENIEQLKGKYTLVIIAHRMSTIKNVDTIYLLDKGKIQASGSFDELIVESAQFKRMIDLQQF